jgi:hypothetical protein
VTNIEKKNTGPQCVTILIKFIIKLPVLTGLGITCAIKNLTLAYLMLTFRLKFECFTKKLNFTQWLSGLWSGVISQLGTNISQEHKGAKFMHC